MLTASSVRSAALTAVAVAAVSSARADSGQTTRAVIRGTGTDVTIVYQAPKSAPFKSAVATASDPIGDALRMKTAGADDQGVVAFLRRREAELPGVIDASVVKQFRKAGAGEPVIQFLSTHVAFDIGETAEGTATAAMPPPGAPYGGEYSDLVEAGYPFYGGGGGYGGSFGRPFGHRGFARRSAAFPFFRPFPPKAHPFPMRPSHPVAMPRPKMR